MYIFTNLNNVCFERDMAGFKWGDNITHKRSIRPTPFLNTSSVFTTHDNLNAMFLPYPGCSRFPHTPHERIWQCEGTPVVSDGLLSGCIELTTTRVIQPPLWAWGEANKKRVFFRYALEAAAALQPLYDWPEARQALDNAAAYYNNSGTILQKHLITTLGATLNKPAFGHIPLTQLAAGESARAALCLAADHPDSMLYLSGAVQCLHYSNRLYGSMGVGGAIDTAVNAVAENTEFTATY